jgi:long-subunit acyl-CoA synthetase (AMP-forming)
MASQARTLVHQIAHWAQHKPNATALAHRGADGAWQKRNYRDYDSTVRAIAKGFIAQGLKPGECVAIVGVNRPEWVLYQFGVIAAGGIPAPIYTTNTVPQVAYIVRQSGSRFAITDEGTRLGMYQQAAKEHDAPVEKTFSMDEDIADGKSVLSLTQLINSGCDVPDADLQARIDALESDDTCMLIYTSGTTGKPKGVQLTHRGMVMIGEALLERFPPLSDRDSYRALSYLPLCHVAEQVFTNVGSLAAGGEVYFCPDLQLLKEYLPLVRPTVFLGVPRVWEKFEAALSERLAAATGLKAILARWAMKTELSAFRRDAAAGEITTSLARKIAHKLVLGKIRHALGIDAVKIAATGAAPIATHTLEFFASLGLTVYEGYGMSETSGVATTPLHGKPVFGSVGQPLPGVQIKIADDGEICLKGANMTPGYFRMPEETEELYEDGWLCTGDLGSLDQDGNLTITGRKKDLIITAGGKNVAPTEIESYLTSIDGIGQAVVVGDRKPYLCALLVLDEEKTGTLCERVGLSSRQAPSELADNPKVLDWLKGRIETDCNAKLAKYQTIKKFKILPQPWSVETGELTPTLKIKRNVINERYQGDIENLYGN